MLVNGPAVSGGILGVFLGGGVIGALVQGPVSTRYGRRMGMCLGAFFLVLGSALTAGAKNLAMFLVGRGLAGIGSSIALTIAPVYISELSAAHARGFMVSFHIVALNSGYLISACASLGFSYVNHPIQWRLNFICNAAISLLLMASILLVPESPRWLAVRSRYDEAFKILEKLHKSATDPDGRLAKAEMYQIREQVRTESELPRGYLHILRTPSLRKRALCTMIVWLGCQSTGVLVIAFLNPTLFAGLGYGSTDQFGLSVAWFVGCILGGALGGMLVDRYGRRLFMFIGTLCCLTCLICETAIQARFLNTSNKPGLSAGVAFIFFFGFLYNFFYDVGSFVYTAEIWPSHLRSEGVTIAMVTFYCCSIAYVAPSTVAFATIGWKYYLVFIVLTTVMAAAVYFILPESAGLTLEEMCIQFGETPVVLFRDLAQDKVGAEAVMVENVNDTKEVSTD